MERYVAGALHLCIAAERQGDLFGVLAFSDRVEKFVRARRGAGHFRACREAVYALEARRVSPEFREVFSFIQTVLRRRALIVFLTSLDDPLIAESFANEVGAVARRHLVLADVLRAPGVESLVDAPLPASDDGIYALLAGQMLSNRLHALRLRLERQGVRMAVIDPEKLNVSLSAQYLDVKRRQAL
jgi:uncharacterized protein (DUF58 family)